MITLTTNTKLQVLLDGTAATTELPVTIGYVEAPPDERALYLTADSITTGATAIDALIGVPDKRHIEEIAIQNVDTAAAVVTVRFYNASGTTRKLVVVTLAVGEGLYYSQSRGWYVLSTNGAQKTTASTDASSAASSATSAGLADSQTRSDAVSAGLASSVGTSAATSAGLADSISRSSATSDGLKNSVIQSEIASGTI